MKSNRFKHLNIPSFCCFLCCSFCVLVFGCAPNRVTQIRSKASKPEQKKAVRRLNANSVGDMRTAKERHRIMSRQ